MADSYEYDPTSRDDNLVQEKEDDTQYSQDSSQEASQNSPQYSYEYDSTTRTDTFVEVKGDTTQYAQDSAQAKASQDSAQKSADTAFIGLEGNIAFKLLPFACPSFSFRRKDNAVSLIGICPSSLMNALKGSFMNDVSIEKTVEFDEILNQIPAIQIREYAQDARIIQIMNAFRMFSAGWEAAKNTTFSIEIWDSVQDFYRKIGPALTKATKGLTPWTSAVDPEITNNLSEEYKSYVLNLPFIMYYQIMTSRTNSRYVLPYSGKIVDASNGQSGWNLFNVGGLKTSNESILGSVINFFGKHLKFNTTPVWDGNTTNDFPQIEVQVDLFNDDVTTAVDNFIFINNIIPKNKFIQYHIFQHNPCVYDIKIEGYNRLYMCSANITCDYKGVSRRPSDDFYTQVSDHAKFCNYNLSPEILKNRNMISIPDVYSLKISFQSLLPNSLNNYLFKFTANNNIFDIDDPDDKTKDVTGAINTAAGEAGKDLEEKLKEQNKG